MEHTQKSQFTFRYRNHNLHTVLKMVILDDNVSHIIQLLISVQGKYYIKIK